MYNNLLHLILSCIGLQIAQPNLINLKSIVSKKSDLSNNMHQCFLPAAVNFVVSNPNTRTVSTTNQHLSSFCLSMVADGNGITGSALTYSIISCNCQLESRPTSSSIVSCCIIGLTFIFCLTNEYTKGVRRAIEKDVSTLTLCINFAKISTK